MSRWKKSPPELVTAFDLALPRHAGLERRQMFGHPCAFARGNLFCGLFQDRVLVRLGADEAAALVARGETEHFSPMADRPMREYVLVPDEEVEAPGRLTVWLERALRYALTLPAKEPTAKRASASTPTPAASKAPRGARKPPVKKTA